MAARGKTRRCISGRWALAVLLLAVLALAGCGGAPGGSAGGMPETPMAVIAEQCALTGKQAAEEAAKQEETAVTEAQKAEAAAKHLEECRAALALTEDYRDSFVHGDKGAEY